MLAWFLYPSLSSISRGVSFRSVRSPFSLDVHRSSAYAWTLLKFFNLNIVFVYLLYVCSANEDKQANCKLSYDATLYFKEKIKMYFLRFNLKIVHGEKQQVLIMLILLRFRMLWPIFLLLQINFYESAI